MNFEEEVHRDGISNADLIDGIDHRIDVPENLGGRDIVRNLVKPTTDFSVKKSACRCRPFASGYFVRPSRG